MIVTVTLNAAIDRTLTVPNFQRGQRHRASAGVTLAGGKGIDVARALKLLGVPVVASRVPSYEEFADFILFEDWHESISVYATDPELVRARDRSLEVLYSAARQGAGMPERDDITGLAVAAWSVVHGFATLWLAGNFRRQLPADLDAGAAIVAEGIAKLGEIIGSQLG